MRVVVVCPLWAARQRGGRRGLCEGTQGRGRVARRLGSQLPNPGAPGLEDLAKIKSGDVVRPARMSDGSHRTIRLRCVTTPDEAQKVLLNRLGLTLPVRLRRIDEVAQM